MGLLSRLFLGTGRLRPALRAELEAEGLAVLEEGCLGSVRYEKFRAPGKRFDGKITGIRSAVGVSDARLVVYSHSGRAKLIDSRFDDPRLQTIGIEVASEPAILFTVDYAKLEVLDVSGVVRIRARTPRAAEIAEQVRARVGR